MFGFGFKYSQNPFYSLFAHIDAANNTKKKIEFGITVSNEYEGIERLNIPHKFDSIDIHEQYLSCHLDNTISVYDTGGLFLFECTKFKYYKHGMFLVGNKFDNEEQEEFGYSVYKGNKKLTDAIYRPYGMSENFNDSGFAIVGIFGKSMETVVIDVSGQIRLTLDYFDHSYLYGVICTTRDGYINLLTGNVICKKGYNSNLTTGELMFDQVHSNCVYQINQKTGDFIIHGIPPKIEEPKSDHKKVLAIEPSIMKGTPPNPKKQSRNEQCNCGSGKKYKNCCINN